MNEFEFQPWETILPSAQQNGPPDAEGEWKSGDKNIPIPLREVGPFLFFNLEPDASQLTAPREWNFIVSNAHNATSNPPRRAFEKLGRGQTLRLLHRRALKLNLWGRFFTVGAAPSRYLLFVGVSGRHLLTSESDNARYPRREWTPWEWYALPNIQRIPSSQLYEAIDAAWQDPDSMLRRAREWHEADYFERLWSSLHFEKIEAEQVRQILRDAVSLIAPPETPRGWILRFQLPERDKRGAHQIDVYEQLFEVGGSQQILLSSAVHAALRELLQSLAPRRCRASEVEFVAQREWLEGNSGVGNWSLDVAAAPLSAHERLETALRLRDELTALWDRERATDWLAPFLAVR